MTAVIATSPKFQFSGADGLPLINGTLTTYLAGTTTPTTTWQDRAQATANTNPIVLDGNGECLLWLDPLVTYKFVLANAVGVQQWSVDNISGAEPGGLRQALAASGGSALVGFIQAGAGAVATTVQSRLRESVSVKDFGAVGDGSDEYAEILAAWTYCLANSKDLFFPAGIYSSGVNNMPFKNPTFPATTLLDCGDITIFGEGPNTILRSDSISGADVLNVYSVKNLHFRNLRIKANLSGSAGAGSNGCSIVGGFDNITLDHVWFEDLPYVDKASYLDGGKALTIQPGTPATECGTIKATNIFAKGCVYGVGLEVDLVNWASKKHAIDVDIVAEDCYHGVLFSAGAATGALSEAMTMGYRVRAQLINCQRSIVIGRAHGIDIDAQIITTKSAAQKRLNPQGGAWNSIDAVVDALASTYAKDSRFAVYGDAGEVDYKVQIGGASAGLSGQGGTTDNCQFYIDLGGQANTAIFNLVNSGGDTTTNCAFYISTTTGVTLASLPVLLFAPAANNTVAVGPAQRLVNVTLQDGLKFAYTDGVTSYNDLTRDSLGLFFRQTGGSSADTQVMGVKDHTGAKTFAVRNDGFLCSDGRATASSVSTVVNVMPIYSAANTLIGYIPIYTSFA